MKNDEKVPILNNLIVHAGLQVKLITKSAPIIAQYKSSKIFFQSYQDEAEMIDDPYYEESELRFL